MDIKSVKQLADLMDERGLASIEVSEGEHKIALTKAYAGVAPAAMPAPQPAVAAPQAAQPAAPVPPAPAAEPEPAGEAITAPLVGVAYMAPAPGKDPFVTTGQVVKKGQTLCIVEAMKVMNEFTAPRDGTIAAICVEDGQLVEFGQCLFRLL